MSAVGIQGVSLSRWCFGWPERPGDRVGVGVAVELDARRRGTGEVRGPVLVGRHVMRPVAPRWSCLWRFKPEVDVDGAEFAL